MSSCLSVQVGSWLAEPMSVPCTCGWVLPILAACPSTSAGFNATQLNGLPVQQRAQVAYMLFQSAGRSSKPYLLELLGDLFVVLCVRWSQRWTKLLRLVVALGRPSGPSVLLSSQTSPQTHPPHLPFPPGHSSSSSIPNERRVTQSAQWLDP